jgi:hypothetical protein
VEREAARELTMLVRFDCPACQGSHSFDMPETTVHMTCSRTHKVLELILTGGGDVRSKVLDGSNGAKNTEKSEE